MSYQEETTYGSDINLTPNALVFIPDNLPQNQIRDFIIRFIKILDIAYIIFIYFVFSIIIAFFFIKIGGRYDVEKDKVKTLPRLSLEIILMIWAAAVTGYILRNIVERIPSPFDNIQGYSHSRLKETSSISSYAVTILLMTSIYNRKLDYFTKRLYNNIERI